MQSGNTQIKPNHKAVRVASNIIERVTFEVLIVSLVTLVIFRRKDYGVIRLIFVTIGIGLAMGIAYEVLSWALTSIPEKPNLDQEQYKTLLKEAKGSGIPNSLFMGSTIVNGIFCAALMALGRYNIFDPKSSSRAAKFIGGLTIFSVVCGSIAMVMFKLIVPLVRQFVLDSSLDQEQKTALMKSLKTFEEPDPENSLINTLVAQVRVNNYYKEQEILGIN